MPMIQAAHDASANSLREISGVAESERHPSALRRRMEPHAGCPRAEGFELSPLCNDCGIDTTPRTEAGRPRVGGCGWYMIHDHGWVAAGMKPMNPEDEPTFEVAAECLRLAPCHQPPLLLRVRDLELLDRLPRPLPSRQARRRSRGIDRTRSPLIGLRCAMAYHRRGGVTSVVKALKGMRLAAFSLRKMRKFRACACSARNRSQRRAHCELLN
jgi:hypothetical protein